MITFNMPSGISHVWNGSHTINVYLHGNEVDVWSLYPSDGRKPTQLEVFACILDREAMSTDHPLVKCQWCGIACQAATEYDTFTCDDCSSAGEMIGRTFTAIKRNGDTYKVLALTEPHEGPFGPYIVAKVIDGDWQGQMLDIQVSDLTATS